MHVKILQQPGMIGNDPFHLRRLQQMGRILYKRRSIVGALAANQRGNHQTEEEKDKEQEVLFGGVSHLPEPNGMCIKLNPG